MNLTPESNEIVIRIKLDVPEIRQQLVLSEKKKESVQKELMTVEELTEYLKVSVTWIYDRTRRDAIPHYKIGRYLRFDPKQIDEWLADNRTVTSNTS